MAFSIKDPEIDKNLRLLSSLTGESLTDAVGAAVAERIEKISLEKEEQRKLRNKKLREFVATLKPAKLPKSYNHKKITDELWGI